MKHYTFNPKGFSKDEIIFLEQCEKQYFNEETINLNFLQKVLDNINIKTEFLKAWEYWKSSNIHSPFFLRQSLKIPVKISDVLIKAPINSDYSYEFLSYNDPKGKFIFKNPKIKTDYIINDDSLGGYFEIVGEYLYFKYDQIIGGTCLAKIRHHEIENIKKEIV